MVGDGYVDEPPAVVREDHKHEQQPVRRPSAPPRRSRPPRSGRHGSPERSAMFVTVAGGGAACTSRPWTDSAKSQASVAPREFEARPRADSRWTSYESGRRCQARTVSGLITVSAERQPIHVCDSHAQSTRSVAVRRRRRWRDLFTTASWCRRARISSARPCATEATIGACRATKRRRRPRVEPIREGRQLQFVQRLARFW